MIEVELTFERPVLGDDSAPAGYRVGDPAFDEGEQGLQLHAGNSDPFKRDGQLGLEGPATSLAEVADGVEQLAIIFDQHFIDDVIDPLAAVGQE